MYWIYLFLFVCMIFTPEVVSGGVFFFGEEDLESLVIFGLGLSGLFLYLIKESALLRTLREKLSLQQESNKIRKDLAQSYSYIGEMNRHLEILKNMIVESPHTARELLEKDQERVYEPVFAAALLLSQSDGVALLFVAKETGAILGCYQSDKADPTFAKLSGEALLGAKKYWWQEDGLSFVRSNEESLGVAAFLAFRSVKNRVEEVGVFQILVTHALLLFSLRKAHTPSMFDLQ